MNASRPARSSSDNTSSNSCSSRFFFSAFSQQESLAHRYAPRPDFLPAASIKTWPSGVRTTRRSSRFGLVSLQETQVRSGTCLGGFTCLTCCFVLLAMVCLLPLIRRSRVARYTCRHAAVSVLSRSDHHAHRDRHDHNGSK